MYKELSYPISSIIRGNGGMEYHYPSKSKELIISYNSPFKGYKKLI